MGPISWPHWEKNHITSFMFTLSYSSIAVAVPAVPRVASGRHRAASQLRRRPHHLEMDSDRAVSYMVDLNERQSMVALPRSPGIILQFYCTISSLPNFEIRFNILIPVVYAL